MGHDISRAECTIYVWYLSYGHLATAGKLGGAVGHSSIKVSDGNGLYECLSWWPGHFPSFSGGQMGWGHAIESVLTSVGDRNASDKDANHEGRKADYKCRITQGLDFNAMCIFARDVKLGTRSVVPGGAMNTGGPNNTAYDFTKQNCSHAVAYCLAAGNPPVAPPLTGWVTNAWTPNHVYSYCIQLATALNAQQAGSAIQKSGTAAWA